MNKKMFDKLEKSTLAMTAISLYEVCRCAMVIKKSTTLTRGEREACEEIWETIQNKEETT